MYRYLRHRLALVYAHHAYPLDSLHIVGCQTGEDYHANDADYEVEA